jgi:hypothetical protein
MTARPAHALHVHVKRLVVDAGALDGMAPATLHAQVVATLRQDLGGASAPLQVGQLASRIGAAAVPAINGRLPGAPAHGVNGGASHG